jgi:hypothetical protein
VSFTSDFGDAIAQVIRFIAGLIPWLVIRARARPSAAAVACGQPLAGPPLHAAVATQRSSPRLSNPAAPPRRRAVPPPRRPIAPGCPTAAPAYRPSQPTAAPPLGVAGSEGRSGKPL